MNDALRFVCLEIRTCLFIPYSLPLCTVITPSSSQTSSQSLPHHHHSHHHYHNRFMMIIICVSDFCKKIFSFQTKMKIMEYLIFFTNNIIALPPLASVEWACSITNVYRLQCLPSAILHCHKFSSALLKQCAHWTWTQCLFAMASL